MSDEKELEQLNDFYRLAMSKAKEWGLAPYETDFHVCPAEKIYEVASYGIPNHYNHWSYGRDYWRQKTMYDHGYGKIYELVINSDPAQAFLLDTNSLLENFFVIAHVIGHSDFFANNAYFEHTNRRIEVSAAAAASRFRDYETEHGRYIVEKFIDAAMSIEEHVDPHVRIKHKPDYELTVSEHQYIDMFPEDKVDVDLKRLEERERRQYAFPYEPQRDIMKFIAEYSPKLKDWQRDILLSVREEQIYFLPQRQTKIMNEGWASIIHYNLMHELDPDCDPGGVDFADTHSGVLSGRPGQLNPYWLGFNIYKRIMEVENEVAGIDKSDWHRPGTPGWDKCLEVRKIERDETFIRNYLDKKICEDLDLFSYEFDDEEAVWWISDKAWEKIRDNLAAQLATMRMPYIVVKYGDYMGLGQLYLEHKWDDRPLQWRYAAETLKAVYKLWGKPVWLETKDDSKDNMRMQFFCDNDSGLVKIIWDDGEESSI